MVSPHSAMLGGYRHCGSGDMNITLRSLTGKKDRQIKLQHLQKVPMWAFRLLVH